MRRSLELGAFIGSVAGVFASGAWSLVVSPAAIGLLSVLRCARRRESLGETLAPSAVGLLGTLAARWATGQLFWGYGLFDCATIFCALTAAAIATVLHYPLQELLDRPRRGAPREF